MTIMNEVLDALEVLETKLRTLGSKGLKRGVDHCATDGNIWVRDFLESGDVDMGINEEEKDDG